MAEVKSSLFRTSARELKPATCKIWINFIYIKNITIWFKRKTTSLVHFTMIEMMIKMMTKMIEMIKMMIEPTSLVHLMMIGQNGCKEGREWWRSNLVASIIIRGTRTSD